jgi:lipopolysaccharide export system protein LptA
VLASGDRLSYLGDDGRVIIDGNASVEIGDKIFQASSITVYIDEERVVAEGGTRTVIPRGQ